MLFHRIRKFYIFVILLLFSIIISDSKKYYIQEFYGIPRMYDLIRKDDDKVIFSGIINIVELNGIYYFSYIKVSFVKNGREKVCFFDDKIFYGKLISNGNVERYMRDNIIINKLIDPSEYHISWLENKQNYCE